MQQKPENSFKWKQQQLDFIGSPVQFPAYIGGVGTGKSASLIAKALFHLKESKDNLGVIVRKNYTDLRTSTIKDFQTYTGLKVNETTHEVRFPNGSTLLFIHGDILDSLKNINCGFFGIEQAEEFLDDTPWQFLKMRLRRNVKFRTGFIIGNTSGHNWIYDIFKKNGPPPNHELIEANTLEFSDIYHDRPDYIENLKTMPKQLYDRYVMNSWEIAEGRIFQMWSERFHVIPDQSFPDWWETFGAIDTAIASGVFSAGLYKVSPEGDVIRFKEYYEKEKLISEHCAAITEMSRPYHLSQWIADPSAFNKTREKLGSLYSIADEFEDYGISLRPGENDVDAGINRIGEYLNINANRKHPYLTGVSGSPRFFMTESCVNGRREIAEYREVPNKLSERGDRKWMPYKHNDHSTDEIRYALMSRPIITSTAPETIPLIKRRTIWSIDHEKELAEGLYG